MTTYYVRKTGNNSNAGTSAGAAWLTVAKALSVITSGDTVYIGAGTYRESGLSFTNTTAASMRYVLGDPTGYYTGDAGEVRITNFTTDDVTAPVVNAHMFNLTNTTYTTWRNITFHFSTSGSYNPMNVGASSTNWEFANCTFVNCGYVPRPLNLSGAYPSGGGGVVNGLVDGCVFFNTPLHIYTSNTAVTNNVNGNLLLRNNMFYMPAYDGTNQFLVNIYSGSGTSNRAGGINVYNNTFVGTQNYGLYGAGYQSSTTPCRVYNNMFVCYYGIAGVDATCWTEDYNFFICTTARTNTSTGTNSRTNLTRAWVPYVFQDRFYTNFLRPFLSPTVEDRALGCGLVTYSPTTDWLGRPRPAGSGVTIQNLSPAAGYMELHDTAVRETGTVDGSGVSIKLQGLADQTLMIPVNDISTTISIKVQWDATHANTTKPRVVLLDNPLIGVTTQTVTATGSSGSWETLSTTAFTPSDRGWVTLRLESRAAAYNGVAYFDTLTVT